MISYALIANGQHNPFLATPLPEHMIYPISQQCDEGLDLDYSALILGKNFIVDSAVYEDVMHSRKSYLAPMQKTFIELKASDLLKCEDYSVYFLEKKDKIVHMTNILLENVEAWLELERQQWKSLKGELSEFQNKYGSQSMKAINLSNIGIESWLARTDQIYNVELRNSLYELFEGKKDIGQVGVENAKGALQFIVAQIVMSDLIYSSTKSSILDWDDSKGMYERLFSMKWENTEVEVELQQQSYKLFNFVMPSLKPNNAEQLAKFMSNNKAVLSLRKTLMELIEEGVSVDSEWMKEYINEIMKADIATQKKSARFQLFGMLMSVLPVSWGTGVAISGGTGLADKILFHKASKYEWYYALQGK